MWCHLVSSGNVRRVSRRLQWRYVVVLSYDLALEVDIAELSVKTSSGCQCCGYCKYLTDL